MKRRLAAWLLGVGAVGGWCCQALAVVTIECVPDDSTLDANQTITAECFITSDVATTCRATQLDMPCSLPGVMGTITSTGLFIDTNHSNPPYLFGTNGIAAVNIPFCRFAGTPPIGTTSVPLPANTPFYLGTIMYQASECSGGNFALGAEGVSTPPDPNDVTRVRDGNNALIQVIVDVNVLMVPTGRCCDGVTCLGNLNQHCCVNVNGGTFTAGTTCEMNPCPCLGHPDCDDGLFCNGTELCIGMQCQPGTDPCTNPNEPLCDEDDDVCGICTEDMMCDDGVFCNGLETCVLGDCVDGSNLPAGTACGDPTDGPCTNPDTCNGFGTCVANNEANGSPCEDGLFCNIGTTCQGGVCQGGGPLNCGDGLPCTTDSCNEGTDMCDNLLQAGFCRIGGMCIAEGTTNPMNDCEACQTAFDTEDWTAKADGTACADEGNDCTGDECMSGMCIHPNLPAGTLCDDGDPCTGTGGAVGDDTCDGMGVCSGMLDPECNDDCVNAVVALEGSTPGNNVNSGVDDAEAGCQPNSNRDIWFKYTATCTGPVLVTTTGSVFTPDNDTVLSVYDACGGMEIACDDDGGPGFLSALTFSAVEGTMYFIRVAGFDGNAGTVLLNIQTINDCVIDGLCYAENDVNPANECEACRPDLSATDWSPRFKGTPCGSPTSSDCDSPDACNGAGVCEPNLKPNGTECTSDMNECTLDICVAGTCEHQNLAQGTACGSPGDTDCDNPDTCDGAGTCLSNLESLGTPCGNPQNTDCDNPDTCDGMGLCLDNFEMDGSACTSDGIDCTSDICDTGVCTHPNLPEGSSCGSTVDTDCDNPDTCNAVGVCLDNLEMDGTSCSDVDICTEGDVCISGICVGTPIPDAPLVVATGSRHLDVTPQPMGSVAPVALRVTSPTYPCLMKWVDVDGTLTNAPVFQLPSDWGTVDVHGPEIVPNALYEVRAECGSLLTDPGSDITWLWADLDNTGVVDSDDILLILDAYMGDFSGVTQENADLADCDMPNGVTDVDDILYVLDAFMGLPYPCPPPC